MNLDQKKMEKKESSLERDSEKGTLLDKTIKINFYDGKIVDIKRKDLSWFSSGSQSIVYTLELENTDLVVKVFTTGITDNKDLFRRIKTIRKRIKRLESVPDSFKIRTIPVGQGYIYAENLEEDFEGEDRYFPFLVFNFVDGITLEDYLRNDDSICSEKRCKALESLRDILCAIERLGLIHCDLYPENFLVDKEGTLYLIDLESGGILQFEKDKPMEKWIHLPLVKGRKGYFCFPPEATDGNFFHFDKWNALYLVFLTLFKQHPLSFMRRIDHVALAELKKVTKHKKNEWPPVIKNKDKIELYLYEKNSEYDIESLRSTINDYLGKTYSQFSEILIKMYIIGLNRIDSRPSFCNDIKPIIMEIIKHARE
ncbi:MAG: lipopolysaccharide kinase InaA family protein [Candidatus Odinarchaeota archaeon]